MVFPFFQKSIVLPSPDTFYCRGCGTCCRLFVVTVSHFDIYRIMDKTGLHPKEFIQMSESDGKDDKEALTYIHGRKCMALKHLPEEQDACRFLDQDNLCSIHEAKPGVCKTWPLDFNNQQEMVWIHRHKKVVKEYCAFNSYQKRDQKLLSQEIHVYNIERQLYMEIVSEWNSMFNHQQANSSFLLEATTEHLFQFLLDRRASEEEKREQHLEETEYSLKVHGN